MKILFVSSEASTLAEVGGLSEVVGSLPKALIAMGHDVRVMIPRYSKIATDKLKLERENIKLSDFAGNQVINIYKTFIKRKIPVYLLDNQDYFGDTEIYGERELDKFLFFSRAVTDLLPKLDFQPQIIHCNDWHTSLIPLWIKQLKLDYFSILTIHNLAYQGWFSPDFLEKYNMAQYWKLNDTVAPQPLLNFLSQGILNADVITTVSNNYTKEILTPELGEGLDSYLKYREKSLFGIVNGIDYEVYNPATDRYLYKKYSTENCEDKMKNKAVLQERVNLPVKEDVPLIGLVQRLEEQKGIDILDSAIYELIKSTDLQVIILGKGRKSYEKSLKAIARKYPDRVSVSTAFNNVLAHMIYAGSDLFLMPSRFEPCGLGQLIAMKYGTIPVVRHTGGLVDTVPPFSKDLLKGNGFIFHEYTSDALVHVVKQAVSAYKSNKNWMKAVIRLMKLDFSWHESALKYVKLYKNVLIKHNDTA